MRRRLEPPVPGTTLQRSTKNLENTVEKRTTMTTIVETGTLKTDVTLTASRTATLPAVVSASPLLATCVSHP